ncbi:MAG: hypothetical protein CBC74_001215 [Crocinitomicaceae bacterium TMED114]|nr:MAG: hypothetical protein CBC74_001215 [Crocinitomicaceae bacterium TMED114]
MKAPIPVAREEAVSSSPAPAPQKPQKAPVVEPAPKAEVASTAPQAAAAASAEAPDEAAAPEVTEPQAKQDTDDAQELDADLAITLGRPKKAATPTGNLAALLGGKSILVEVEEKKEKGAIELSDTSQLEGAYDESSVREAWATLGAHLRGQNKVGMAATLSGGELVFEDPLIRFTVANEVQAEELKECAAELLHFVRTTVGSGKIGLEVFVSEGEAAPAFLSPKDRYVKWAEENPALEVLRKRLDLDLG